jgi:hypothetical protein
MGSRSNWSNRRRMRTGDIYVEQASSLFIGEFVTSHWNKRESVFSILYKHEAQASALEIAMLGCTRLRFVLVWSGI